VQFSCEYLDGQLCVSRGRFGVNVGTVHGDLVDVRCGALTRRIREVGLQIEKLGADFTGGFAEHLRRIAAVSGGASGSRTGPGEVTNQILRSASVRKMLTFHGVSGNRRARSK
jgi:hypothetical protein